MNIQQNRKKYFCAAEDTKVVIIVLLDYTIYSFVNYEPWIQYLNILSKGMWNKMNNDWKAVNFIQANPDYPLFAYHLQTHAKLILFR